MSLDRYYEMLAERGIQPFQRIPWVNPRTGRAEPKVRGEPLPLQWRISRDEFDRLTDWADEQYQWRSTSMDTWIAGWPVIVDDDLPPWSVALEEIGHELGHIRP